MNITNENDRDLDDCNHVDAGRCDECSPFWESQENRTGISFYQGVLLAGLLFLIWASVAVAQIYKYGQRHPDLSKYCTYAAAIELADERETMGYVKGFAACKEQF